MFTCKVPTDSNSVKWTKDDITITENEHYELFSEDTLHTLTLRNTESSDSGVYLVHVGNISRRVNLNIKAYFLEDPADTECKEGEDAMFTCKVPTDSNSVKWTKDDKTITENEHYEMSSEDTLHTLTLKNTETSDSGEYWVHVGNISRRINLNIKGI
ncbi:Hypothetical predicted protein [Mytilus galloprovincialis]|uniref:Ig-like domain-containing protein n=1 Tax=Mytilus galloprovincialis TaxID=29158 RepID=A0A8B6FNM6_MYTGA|nr:Hypothetical predicted protein [Mytilus galloprovincialis]